MANNFECALTKEVCPVCAKEMDGPLIINKRLTPGEAKKVKDLHGKIIGFSDKPCKDCAKCMETAFMLVVCDKSKSEDTSNPYRTGQIFGVTKEFANRLLVGQENILNKGVAYIHYEDALKMGFPVEYGANS